MRIALELYLFPRRAHANPFGGDQGRCRAWPIIRQVLTRYLPSPRGNLQLRKDTFGKPVCRGVTARRIHFSVAHARGLTLLAVSCVPVGVDVEAINRQTLLAPQATGMSPIDALGAWIRWEAMSKVEGFGLRGKPATHPTQLIAYGRYLAAVSIKRQTK